MRGGLQGSLPGIQLPEPDALLAAALRQQEHAAGATAAAYQVRVSRGVDRSSQAAPAATLSGRNLPRSCVCRYAFRGLSWSTCANPRARPTSCLIANPARGGSTAY